MGCCGPWVLRVLEIVLCALVLLLPLFSGSILNPYGMWCQFSWIFCLVVAVFILVVEMLQLDKVVQVILQHGWADLSCGLTLLCALLLLSVWPIYAVHFVCGGCVIKALGAILPLVAFVVFAVDGVCAKLKGATGYLSGVRGALRWGQAHVACVLFASSATYFLGVRVRVRPMAMLWCVVVYVVCFPATVVIILFHLLKMCNALLCCALDWMEVVVNGVSVALYISAAVLWMLYGYRDYRYNSQRETFDRRYRDFATACFLTFVNLGLYTADLIWSVLVLCKRR